MVRIILLMMFFYMAMPVGFVLSEGKPPTWVPTPEERPEWMPLKPDEVLIAYSGVSMPLGRVLLAKNGPEYCAIKFTDTWLGESKHDHYSSYEFYYQGDGSGDFSKSNVISGTGELYFPKIQPLIFDLGYSKGSKKNITCGKMIYKWLFVATVLIDKNELAPTPWTHIKDVNVNDPRVRWYKKDSDRKRVTVPIDQLW